MHQPVTSRVRPTLFVCAVVGVLALIFLVTEDDGPVGPSGPVGRLLVQDDVVDLVVPEELGSPRASESVVRQTDAQVTSVDNVAVDAAGSVQWVRRDTSDEARSRILARQGKVRELLAIVRGELKLAKESEYAGNAKMAALMSIMVIFDAEGRSSRSQTVPGDPEIGIPPRKPDFPHHKISSGGAWYMVPKGEFPAFDSTKRLMSDSADDVPMTELPLDEIALLCERALSYQLP